MRKIDDYRQHAEQCREMARRARGPEERDMLLNMAETWESLARDREQQLQRKERLKKLDVVL
jgi:hypothetical protein